MLQAHNSIERREITVVTKLVFACRFSQ